MKYLYELKTKLGFVYIAVLPNGKYTLVNEGYESFDEYDRPEDVADSLFTHTSQWFDWDCSDFDCPDGLGEWSRLPL